MSEDTLDHQRSLPEQYDPTGIEPQWVKSWQEQKAFEDPTGEPYFSLNMITPNVTGDIHIGHAWMVAIEDALARWKRMQGYRTLYVPGLDHGGIALQRVVEKSLKEQGVNPRALTKGEFLNHCRAWVAQYEPRMKEQLLRLGASCDWNYYHFTLDRAHSGAVAYAFYLLYEKGLIQQEDYIVNWCPTCESVLSDIEVASELRASGSEARPAIVQELEQGNFPVKTESVRSPRHYCSHCRTRITHVLSKQWFFKIAAPAASVAKLIQQGEIEINPAGYKERCLYWLDHARDWCISRQIKWGHRIPIWYCADCHKVTVSAEPLTRCSHCPAQTVRQDEDVLDTWFSSALIPASWLGWPQQTPAMQTFYPYSVVETGHDILFFWLIRTLILHYALLGQLPYKRVFLHGLVLDEAGRKMGKSLGNSLSAEAVINEHGADALRFGLLAKTFEAKNINFSAQEIERAKQWANKVWQAARFIEQFKRFIAEDVPVETKPDLVERWITSRFNKLVEEITTGLEQFKFSQACTALQRFWRDEFCNIFIEYAQLPTHSPASKKSIYTTLRSVLKGVLCLLHPFMPFITEEIWTHLEPKEERAISIARAHWPRGGEMDLNAEQDMSIILDLMRGVRRVRSKLALSWRDRIPAVLVSRRWHDLLVSQQKFVSTLLKLQPIEIAREQETTTGSTLVLDQSGVQVYFVNIQPRRGGRE